ncbi:MAG: DUF4394 domain-containing protein [Thioalkalivibrionaceae bacterium]
MNFLTVRTLRQRRLVPAVAAAVAMLTLAGCSSSSDDPVVEPGPVLDVFGVTSDNRLIRFSSEMPSAFEVVGPLSRRFVSIDFRPATGELFALDEAGALVVLNPETGDISSFVTGQVSSGAELFGAIDIDFNPAANALRLVGSERRNLRLGPAALMPNASQAAVEDGIFGYRVRVGDTAYDNNAARAGTTHYFIDSSVRFLATQASNPGLVTRIGPLFDDSLPTTLGGYDIFQPQADAPNEHYAIMTRVGEVGLYRLSRSSGAATLILNFDVSDDGVLRDGDSVVDLTTTAGPTAMSRVFTMLVQNAEKTQIVRVTIDDIEGDDLMPTVERLDIAAVEVGDTIVSIDQRTTAANPALNGLWALGRAGTQGRLYRLTFGPDEVRAEAVAVLRTNTLGPAEAVALQGDRFRMDFNPAVDLLRILSDSGQNLRVNPDQSREVAGEVRPAGFTFVDGTTRLNNVDVPVVTAVAYRPQPQQLSGEIPSLDFQYVIDQQAGGSRLARVIVPNDGALVEVGDLGVGRLASGQHGFDITAMNRAIAALTPAASESSVMYSINLRTGAASPIGTIGDGSFTVRAISATVSN